MKTAIDPIGHGQIHNKNWESRLQGGDEFTLQVVGGYRLQPTLFDIEFKENTWIPRRP
ncbi:MAG: hypothetical protein KIH69_009050 [Anaerolineae bacterium]|nr:hypothetical protein [Anaerolineae bacterium]